MSDHHVVKPDVLLEELPARHPRLRLLELLGGVRLGIHVAQTWEIEVSLVESAPIGVGKSVQQVVEIPVLVLVDPRYGSSHRMDERRIRLPLELGGPDLQP